MVALQVVVCIHSIKTWYRPMNNIHLYMSDNRLVQHFARSVGEHTTFLGEPTETQHAVFKHAADAQHEYAKHDSETRRLVGLSSSRVVASLIAPAGSTTSQSTMHL